MRNESEHDMMRVDRLIASILHPKQTMNDSLLMTLGELVRKEVSAEQILSKIVDVMAQELKADRATIYWLDRSADELVSVAAHLPEIEAIRVPVQQGVAGYVARSRQLVNIPHCDEDVRFWSQVDDATGYQTRSMLAGPILDEFERVVGVVQFLNKDSGEFNAEDEAHLKTLAEQASALLKQTTLAQRRRYVGEDSEATLELEAQFNRVIGSSDRMREVFRRIGKVAPTDATVLMLGESGTGKTLLARAVHHNSRRAAKPFIHVDCTTLPEGLIENELFGHEKGAYTGASSRAAGKVEAADGGTLFLDEVGDLPLSVQGKLLTLIQNRTYSRVGGTTRQNADIRIVAATNRDLQALVASGEFREDLYYRLNVVQIQIPPLRDRGREDLLQLIDHFVDEAARRHRCPVDTVSDQALSVLLNHPWPGNVRELQNCLEAAVIFAEGHITPDVLSLPMAREAKGNEFAGLKTLEDLEGRYIKYVLEQTEGNRSEAARVLGIGRNTLLRKMKTYGLE